ncbi:MAG: response regulator [Dehalococcoidia bacterium]
MEKIRVFLADSQVLYREGMRMALLKEGDIEVIGEADDGEEALYQIKALSPDIVILDSELPSLSGLELTRQIRRHSPTTSTILMAGYEDDEQLLLAIRAGAAGCLTKKASDKEIVRQVRKAYRGGYPINESLLTRPGVALSVLYQFQDLLLAEKEIEPLISPLSRRETEILEYIARGNSNKEIAYSLGICNQTVKNHVTSIMRKLAANDRTHAVVLALRLGMIRMH